MDDDIETNAQAAQPDAQALQAAQAGYSRRKGLGVPSPAPAPVEVAEPPLADKTPAPAPAADDAPAAEGTDEPSLKAEPAAAPTVAPEAISEQLDDLKAQIRELRTSGVDASTVHRLFGEIGGITRVVKQLQANAAPSENELAGAIKAAEKTAEEYPEIGGPMVAALKALAKQLPAQPEQREEPSASSPPPPAPSMAPAPAAAPTADPYTPEQRAAINVLNALHPDRATVSKSTEFSAWMAAKPAADQDRFWNSWDLPYVAKALSEFKAANAARQQAAEDNRRRKNERLEAAVTPQGSAATPTPTTLTPEAQARKGYERYRSKRL